jgi:hypothetical protein
MSPIHAHYCVKTKEEEEEEEEEGVAAGEPTLYPSARWPTAETTTVLSAPYLYSMELLTARV